jgi:hypothetical protein
LPAPYGRELEETVNVVAGSDVLVKVALQGDQFAIQR